MATLTPTLTLTSTDAFAHQNISISVTDSLTITAPYSDVSRFDTGDTNDVGAGAGIIFPTGFSATTYVYVRHLGLAQDGTTASTNLCTLSDAGGSEFMSLAAGEFAFFPVKGSEGLKAAGVGADVLLEYAYFTKG
tara:strand:+ start:1378 stop:1782 length:405 start_codon:yes stop_codon:yes gene_type:complete